MNEKRIFVGRQAELDQFRQVLEDPRGQAILVVGQAGMGKSWLLDEMAAIAREHADLRCGCVQYELTSEDSVDAVMERMIEDAFRAGDVVEGSFDPTAVRRKQWYALLETMVPKGEKIARLIQSFQRDAKRPTREEFLDRLRLISDRMKTNGRAIFLIDPWEYLASDCVEAWAIVVAHLPAKIKLVFAQRDEDALARHRKFTGLPNVVRIPPADLGKLDEEAVSQLVKERAHETEYGAEDLRTALRRYDAHPYALQGALDLLAERRKLEELPDDPTDRGIVEEQWERICQAGEQAIRLFKAYAILEVPTPDDVVEHVAEIESDTRLSLVAGNRFLAKLLSPHGQSKRLYHVLLAKYVVGRMDDDERNTYHARAVEIYRARLKQAKDQQTATDALAATRLAEHVLAAEGKKAFVDTFVGECGQALMNLGLLDAFISLSQRGLRAVESGSAEEATLLGNLGLIYETRGDLDEAEKMLKKALEIFEKLRHIEGMAIQYGNLGLIYRTRGDLDQAEKMHKKSLEIFEKLGHLERMASQYGNLGLIYQTRGDLDEAEKMFKKSLEIDDKLGRLEGMANAYGNLGLIYQTRGDLDEAEKMLKKSLEIDEKLGHLEGMASDYGNLGLIYQARGDLDQAEKMHNQALGINQKLGRLEGMAIDHSNLGSIQKQRGDVARAREYWGKALAVFQKIGMAPEVAKVQSWIDGLEESKE